MKILKGKVVSAKATKTVGVEVTRLAAHPRYGKRMKKKRVFPAHNEIGAKEGNEVEIGETRPISKTKSWKVIRILD